ncbi:MAG: hypothetical protein ACTSRB_14720 [Candidatus Helarchaeota archaeon]
MDCDYLYVKDGLALCDHFENHDGPCVGPEMCALRRESESGEFLFFNCVETAGMLEKDDWDTLVEKGQLVRDRITYSIVARPEDVDDRQFCFWHDFLVKDIVAEFYFSKKYKMPFIVQKGKVAFWVVAPIAPDWWWDDQH